MKNNGGNSLSKCQLVKTMSKARVRNTCNGEKRVVLLFAFHWHFGNILSLFFHTFRMLLFFMGLFIYLFIIIVINYNASYMTYLLSGCCSLLVFNGSEAVLYRLMISTHYHVHVHPYLYMYSIFRLFYIHITYV